MAVTVGMVQAMVPCGQERELPMKGAPECPHSFIGIHLTLWEKENIMMGKRMSNANDFKMAILRIT